MKVNNSSSFVDFYPNKDLEFSLSSEISNSTGAGSFFISGNNANLELLKFSGSRVFDFDNKFIFSYSSRQDFQISGDLNDDRLSLFANGNPLIIGKNLPDSATGKSWERVIVKSTGCEIDFDLVLSSKNDAGLSFLVYDSLGGKYLTGSNISGVLQNYSPENKKIKIFSSTSSFNYQGYSLNSGIFNTGGYVASTGLQFFIDYQTGNFIPSFGGEYSRLDSLDPINYSVSLSTSAGPFIFTGSIPISGSADYYLNFSLDSVGHFNNSDYVNFQLFEKNCNGSFFNAKFKPINGFTGKHYQNINDSYSGSVSGVLSGFLSGSGRLTSGCVSGILTGNTGVDYFGNKVELKNYQYCLTGAIDDRTPIFPATGNISYDYNVFLSGGSGYRETEPYWVPAVLSGYTGVLTGYSSTGGFNWSNIEMTGVGASGRVFIQSSYPSGPFDLSVTGWTGNFTGKFNFQKTKTGIYQQGFNSSSWVQTGIYNIKTWEDNFYSGCSFLYSRNNSENLNNAISFSGSYNTGSGYFEINNGFISGSDCFNPNSKYFGAYFSLNHLNPFKTTGNLALLEVTSSNYSFSGYFTGSI